MATAKSHNLRNPAVKRILQELKEFQTDNSGDVVSEPLEDNIFEWQFAIRGAVDTDFEGGIYHGRILLPAEYPFKPPSFLMQTPNGRFEVGTKLCLSISQHHPEHWQPSWSVRTALVALIAMMPSPPEGAIGGINYPPEECRALARKSRTHPPKVENPVRQKLIQELHAQLLRNEQAQPAPATPPADSSTPSPTTDTCDTADGAVTDATSGEAEETAAAAAMPPCLSPAEKLKGDGDNAAPGRAPAPTTVGETPEAATRPSQDGGAAAAAAAAVAAAAPSSPSPLAAADACCKRQSTAAAAPSAGADVATPSGVGGCASCPAHADPALSGMARITAASAVPAPARPVHVPSTAEDRVLHWLTIFLSGAILALLLRKVLIAMGQL